MPFLPQKARYLPGHPDFWDPECYLPQLPILPKFGALQPFNLWSHQRILAAVTRQAYQEMKWIVHLKSRRTGSSSFFVGIGYQHASSRPGCRVAVLANKRETAQELSTIAIRFWNGAPPGLKPRRTRGLKRTLEFPDLDSRMTIHSVKDDEPLRGGAAPVVIATEIAFWLDSKAADAWVAARNTVPERGGFLVAEGTPNFDGDPLHLVCLEAQDPDSKWIYVFIPWTRIDEYALAPRQGWAPRADVKEYADRHHITEAQAFWMQTEGLPKCNNDMEKFKSEYPVNDAECWARGGEAIFNVGRLLEWLDALTEGIAVGHEEATEYVEWLPPEARKRYLIYCDPASSWAKKDKFGVEILDIQECSQVAEFLGHCDAYTMARWLNEWSIRYNDALIYVEANGVGDAVLSHLLAMGCRNVYHRPQGQHSHVRIPGWYSNVKTKAEAIGLLQELINDGSIVLRSARLIRQLISYRGAWDRLDRDAAGGHHDLVAALAGAAWAWRKSVGAAWSERKLSERDVAAMNWNRTMRLIDAHEGLSSGLGGSQTPWGVHR